MSMSTERADHISFLAIPLFFLVAVLLVSAVRYIFLGAYTVSGYAPCNPETKSCFEWCDKETCSSIAFYRGEEKALRLSGCVSDACILDACQNTKACSVTFCGDGSKKNLPLEGITENCL